MLAIADAYGVKKFAVVGRSGSRPRSRMRGAVARAHDQGGRPGRDRPARRGRAGLVRRHRPLRHGVHGGGQRLRAIVAHTKAVAEEVRANPASLLARLQTELPDSGPAGRGRSRHPVHADRDLRGGPAGVLTTAGSTTRSLSARRGDSTRPRSGCPRRCGTAPATCSPPPVTPGGWRTGSPAPPWSCRPGRPTSARWTCCRTSSAGCPPAGRMPADPVITGFRAGGLADRPGPTGGRVSGRSDLRRLQVAVNMAPVPEQRGMRVLCA